MTRVVDMPSNWTDQLARNNQGTVIGDERNVIKALRTAPGLRNLIRYDEFALRVEFTKPPPWRDAVIGDAWADDDDTALSSWLQAAGLAVRGRNVVSDCVSLIAKDHRVHPVREYLDGLRWDGKKRIDKWLKQYLNADGDENYLAAVGQCWLISAIARAMQPGCKADHVLVLESPQGTFKSTAAAVLAALPEWFADNVGDVRNKDAALQLCGKWIIELSELSNIRKADVEAVKGYLSRTQDVFRPPYGRRAVTVPRQCVFIGTTNEKEYLRDRTGNRRYWPVACRGIDIDALQRDRDLLWAEAVHCYRADQAWHLDAAANALAIAEQDSRLLQTELDASVAEYLEEDVTGGEITTKEIFVNALNLKPSEASYHEQTKRMAADVAAALEKAGWERVGQKGGKGNRRTVYRKRVP